MSQGRETTRKFGAAATQSISVSELNRSIRDLLEHRYPLLRVHGELSNVVRARSGHWYFTLKDAHAQVRCAMFRNRAQVLDWEPDDGARVEVGGLVTLYEARGDFQLVVDSMRRAGRGALYEAFLRLKAQLEREGLISAERRRSLPPYPRAIGIVTSLEAAALRDVLSTLQRRNPSVPVIVYPTSVQGAGAATEISRALSIAGERQECDVLIVCRGGGSIEDLWPFNEEAVARAVAASPIPVISGVGHETDFTITDFVADHRAATPTAAAGMAAPAMTEMCGMLRGLLRRLSQRMYRTLEAAAQRSDGATRRIRHPGQRLDDEIRDIRMLAGRLRRAAIAAIDQRRWRTDSLVQRAKAHRPPLEPAALRIARVSANLAHAMRRTFELRNVRVVRLQGSLGHLDPRQVLQRGFSLVRDSRGRIVRDAANLAAGANIEVTLARGELQATVTRSTG